MENSELENQISEEINTIDQISAEESSVVQPPPIEFVSEAEEYVQIMNQFIPDSPMSLQLKKSEEFLKVCATCPKLLPTFKMCIEDGSFVEASSKVPGRACPLGKWIY